MGEPFELVNLAASQASTTASANHESSDDGLDPYEFISQDEVNPSKAQRKSQTPDGSPTPLNSELYKTASNLAETLNASKMMDSLHSFVSLHTNSGYPSYNGTNGSPFVHLQETNNALQNIMWQLAKKHESLLSKGSNCVSIRLDIENAFIQLSENNLQLHELYNIELEYTNAFREKLLRWDSKRSGVLKKIRLIKSDDNKYGLKLQGLLDKRDEVDEEMKALEERLVLLGSKKRTLDTEIGETISVLESKSAKYVSLFRNLEKQGEDAIMSYLSQDLCGKRPQNNLLRKFPVDSSFSARNRSFIGTRLQTTEGVKTNIALRTASPNSTPLHERSTEVDATIGIVPYSIPSNDPLPPPPKNSKRDSTAYEKGYSTGAKQVEIVKEGLAKYFTTMFAKPELPGRANPTLDDELNIITEMIDFKPINHFLNSQSEALEAVLLKTSRLAESYHKFSMEWRDIAKYMEAQEDKIYDLMSSTEKMNRVVDILNESFEFLLRQAKTRLACATGREYEEKHLLTFIKNECAAISMALTTLLGDSKYTSQLEALHLPVEVTRPINNHYALESRITATENVQSDSFRENLKKLLQQKSFKKSTEGFYLLAFTKALKKE